MRREERRERTVAALLDAATEVFGSRGIHAATVDDVARRAGLTKGAVYANFPSKDALVLAVLDRHLADQLAQVEALAAVADWDELRTGLEGAATRSTTGHDVGLLLLELWLYAARDPGARAALAERYGRLREALTPAVERWRAVEAPSGEAIPAEKAAMLALALDAGSFLMGILEPGAVAPALRAAALVRTLRT